SPLRAGVSLAVLAGLAGAVFLPLDRSLAVPALLTHERLQYVGAPFAGRIVHAPPAAGQPVVAGQVLLVVENLERNHEQARIELELRRNRAEQQALDTRGSEGGYRRWLEEDERRLLAARERAASRLAQLVVTASAPGEVVERAADFQPGDTVAADQVLATVRQSARLRVHAYVQDRAGARLDARAVVTARLHAWDRDLPMLEVPVVDARLTPLDRLAAHALYDRYGGPMVAVAERPGQGASPPAVASGLAGPPLRPRDAHQDFSFSVDLPALAARIPEAAPAWVELRLEPVSLARRFLDFTVRELSR
ncbi:membrane-fusion protein, partial [Thauera phenylacetica B4P]